MSGAGPGNRTKDPVPAEITSKPASLDKDVSDKQTMKNQKKLREDMMSLHRSILNIIRQVRTISKQIFVAQIQGMLTLLLAHTTQNIGRCFGGVFVSLEEIRGGV